MDENINERLDNLFREVKKYQHYGKNVEAMTLLQSVEEETIPQEYRFNYYFLRLETELKIKGAKDVCKWGEKAIENTNEAGPKAAIYTHLATYAIQQQDYTLAQQYISQCLSCAPDDGTKASAYKLQGRLDFIRKDYDKAIENQNIAAMYAEKDHDERLLFYIIMEIANAWYEKGFMSTSLMEVDRAEEYAKLCHELPLFNRCAIRKAQILYQMNRDDDARKAIMAVPKQLD